MRSFLDGLQHDELIYLAGDATYKVLPGDWGLYRLVAAAKRWEGGVGCTALVTIGLGFLAKEKADQMAPILSKILQWHSERGNNLWQAHQMMQDKSQAISRHFVKPSRMSLPHCAAERESYSESRC